MGYGLGIDVGTTFSAAAINRDGIVEILSLATYQVAVPSVIFADGAVMLFGDSAERRGAVQPDGLAREFKRRLGDPVPLMLSGSPYHADRLTALMAQSVVETASAQLGSAPSQIVLTHPANWTEYQLGTLRNALADVGLNSAELMSEPAAAALDFSVAAHIEPGSTVLVYDLGGGTFDVAMLRREGDSFVHQVEPAGIERLGGIDFDEAVFQFIRSAVPNEVLEAARHSPEGAAAIAQLRRRCVDAKQALSSEVATDIPIMLPGYTSTVRLTRPQFEEMIRPMVRQTIEVVRAVLDRGQIEPTALAAVLLVGGSSRIPLVPQMVNEELGLPVRIDAHPKLVVARGAARRAGMAMAHPAAAVTDVDGGEARRRSGRPWLPRVAAVLVAALVLAVVGFWFFLRDDTAAVVTDVSTTSAATSSTAAASTSTSVTQRETTTVPAPAPVSVVVPGDVQWTDTGIVVAAGDVLKFEATGSVSPGQGISAIGPEGDATFGFQVANYVDHGVRLGGNHSALIGRIGSEPPFHIGVSTSVPADSAGPLQLGVNDQGVENNTGSFDVSVTVTPLALVDHTTTTVPAPVPVNIVVPGDVQWTDTAIDVAAGDVLKFVATGSVSPGAGVSAGPDGASDPAFRQFNEVDHGVTLGGNHSALIGRIGTAPPFLVGASAAVPADRAGPLQLGVNDAEVENNSGEWDVTVTVTPARSPTS